MDVLESCLKHNMVAYLEKTDGNAEFHEIIDFLTRSSIHHALTVSPVVSTTFVEQFWTSAKSKIINNVRHITAKVAGKPVSISEASIRSDLLFDDANGIDSLPNHDIFDAIQLMGYEGDLTTVLVGIIEVTYQAMEIKHLKAQIKKLKKKAKPVITHHRAWMKSVSLKQRLAVKKSLKSNWMQNDSVSKQGRKSAKAEPSVHKDPLFDELPEDTLDYMETEDAKKREDKRCSIVVKLKKEGYSNNNYFHTVGDDETIAQVLLNMSQAKAVSREKEKGVELKDVEKIEYKKEKEKEESETESEGIPEAEKIMDERDAFTEKKEQISFMIQLQLKEGLMKVFTAVGSTEDERRIKEMNEGVKDTDQKKLKEEDTAKVPAKVEVTEQGTKKRKGGHIKMIARKSQENSQMYVNSVMNIENALKDLLIFDRANGNFRAFNYLMEVLHIFDRQDLYHLYNLMMEQYSEITLEGIELILWGDLKIMMESSTEGNDQSDFWDDQQDVKLSFRECD
ncbi:hypothetical protein Tco_0379461 [Tanacetum coccineum]